MSQKSKTCCTWMGNLLPILPETLYSGGRLKDKSRINDYFTVNRYRLNMFRILADEMLSFDLLRVYSSRRQYCLGIFSEFHIIFDLDLHGFNARFAKKCFHRFMELMIQFRVPRIRVIHGAGYVLPNIVFDYIRRNNLEYNSLALAHKLPMKGAVDVFLDVDHRGLWESLDTWHRKLQGWRSGERRS